MTTLTTTTRRGLLAGVVLGLLFSATGCSSRASGPDQRTGQQAMTSSVAGLEHRLTCAWALTHGTPAVAQSWATGLTTGSPMCSTMWAGILQLLDFLEDALASGPCRRVI